MLMIRVCTLQWLAEMCVCCVAEGRQYADYAHPGNSGTAAWQGTRQCELLPKMHTYLHCTQFIAPLSV